jgi:hypothetical protein
MSEIISTKFRISGLQNAIGLKYFRFAPALRHTELAAECQQTAANCLNMKQMDNVKKNVLS